MRRSAISAPLFLTAALFAPTIFAGCSSLTSTYGTGQSPEMALFSEMTGGILNKGKKKEPIEYQPRAPLVMPPTAATATASAEGTPLPSAAGTPLPPPMETASAASPDWPMDPSERIGPAGDGTLTAQNLQSEYRRLRPLAGVFPEQARPTYDIDETGKQEYYNTIVHGRRQRDEFRQALAESKGYGRTERRFLTDPPTAYREPIPTAPTGEEAVLPKKKKGNFFTRWWSGS